MTKLNKFIAQSGLCSRRKATELIKDQQVTVNGKITIEPFYEVIPTDAVKVKNKLITLEQTVRYFIFNKPQDVLCTSDDPKNRRTIIEFFKKFKERLYPIGRLDRNTTGIIIVTNDGELTQKLSHPKFKVAKTYMVTTHKPVTPAHFDLLYKGVRLEDGYMKVDKARRIPRAKNVLSLTIHSGKKHIIKRLFKQLGYFVEKLDRTHFASLSKRGLKLGDIRPLTTQEIEKLKNL